MSLKKLIIVAGVFSIIPGVYGQRAVQLGKATYAEFPPAYKSKHITGTDAGGNPVYEGSSWGTQTETRHLYVDESSRLPSGERRPLPTNDWWTDIMINQYSGALWALPQMLQTTPAGIEIVYPTYWKGNGGGAEVKARSAITVGGRRFRATETRALDWHDWDVKFRMVSDNEAEIMDVTLAHGQPFTWVETAAIDIELGFLAKSETMGPGGAAAKPGFFDDNGDAVAAPVAGATCFGVRIGNDLYGVYLPQGASVGVKDGKASVTFAGDRGFVVVGMLREASQLASWAEYAYSVPRKTEVTWDYDEARALLNTHWRVNAENLNGAGLPAPSLQGFLPHAYKHWVNPSVSFTGTEFLTPRGTMRVATGSEWDYSYRFAGMLPTFGAPEAAFDDSFNMATATDLIERYAQGGTFGTDTYWGGKGLVQMAMNMTFAKGLGNTGVYDLSKKKLRDALVNWFTYTPGKDEQFFSYFPRWGSMVGYNVSYDSDQFNDHHFHYGYFLYAGALLCLEDKAFARDYGPMLRHIAKEYANWEHDSADFPFLRTMDPWVGHSYAGGFGDHGNDNGNGQESSSEAMQGWGGVYLLGLALNDRPLRDAGIFGWLTESKGTAEYWYDRDHVTGRHGEGNYDYTGFDGPYNCNITAKGIGWWNWFAGPWWNHIIQWMPISPCLNYLSEDLDFTRWEYGQFENNNPVDWWEKWPNGGTDAAGNPGMEDAMADASLGNVVVNYLQRFDPERAAEIFDRAYAEGRPMARGIDTGHISYYAIHSHLTYGDNDFTAYADYPAASVFRRADGTETFMVYNNEPAERVVRFYRDGALIKTVKAAPGQLTVFADDPVATSLRLECADGQKLPAGHRVQLSAAVLDQYGATVDGAAVAYAVNPAGVASVDASGMLTVGARVADGVKFNVKASYGQLSQSFDFVVGQIPALKSGRIVPAPEYVECGTPLQFAIADAVDADGDTMTPDAAWSVTLDGAQVGDSPDFTPSRAGKYTVAATADGTRLTHSFVVLPQLPNIALGKQAVTTSEQNAGTLTESLTDGDASTRWGSKEGHDDGEWAMVDLGADAYMARLSINWETSYAAIYDVQVAPDGCPVMQFEQKKWNDANYMVTIPAESAWTTVLPDVSISRPGVDNQQLGVTGRYLRVKPKKRSNQYGYSIYELAVHGVASDADPAAVAALQIDCPEVADEGEAVEISAKGVTLAGDIVPVGDVVFEADIDGAFNGNVFTPATYGVAHITARSGRNTATATMLVNERERIRTLTLTPATIKTLADTRISIVPSAQSQFGAVVRLGSADYQAVVTDHTGKPAADASYDKASNLFVARENGRYTLTVTADGISASATVEVVPFAEANLALMRTATATSETSAAALAVDGDMATRWESNHAEGEYITVDLEEAYIIDRLRLYWEAAYAAEYTVYGSLDGEAFSEITSRTATPVFTEGKGLDEFSLPMPTPARYIRIVSTRRATAYGVSLWELEVYGTGRYEAVDEGFTPVFSEISLEQRGTSLYAAVAATHAGGYVIHDITVTETGFDGPVLQAATVGTVPVNVSRMVASGERFEAEFPGVRDRRIYSVSLTARDLFGNSVTEQRSHTASVDMTDVNLALGKHAEATSSENGGSGAEKAVDGDPSTAWKSAFEDPQTLTVDLGDIYSVDKVVLTNPDAGAWCRDYTVETSTDGREYKPVAAVNDAPYTAMRTFDFDATPARYVRVVSTARGTQYGNVIGELQVYGRDDIYTSVDSVGRADARADVHTPDGRLLFRGVTRGEALRRLSPGIYLHGSDRIAVH